MEINFGGSTKIYYQDVIITLFKIKSWGKKPKCLNSMGLAKLGQIHLLEHIEINNTKEFLGTDN